MDTKGIVKKLIEAVDYIRGSELLASEYPSGAKINIEKYVENLDYAVLAAKKEVVEHKNSLIREINYKIYEAVGRDIHRDPANPIHYFYMLKDKDGYCYSFDDYGFEGKPLIHNSDLFPLLGTGIVPRKALDDLIKKYTTTKLPGDE